MGRAPLRSRPAQSARPRDSRCRLTPGRCRCHLGRACGPRWGIGRRCRSAFSWWCGRAGSETCPFGSPRQCRGPQRPDLRRGQFAQHFVAVAAGEALRGRLLARAQDLPDGFRATFPSPVRVGGSIRSLEAWRRMAGAWVRSRLSATRSLLRTWFSGRLGHPWGHRGVRKSSAAPHAARSIVRIWLGAIPSGGPAVRNLRRCGNEC